MTSFHQSRIPALEFSVKSPRRRRVGGLENVCEETVLPLQNINAPSCTEPQQAIEVDMGLSVDKKHDPF